MSKPAFQVVILAAGRGSRLAQLGYPKPLLPLQSAGGPQSSLLERQVHLLKALGASISVVIGHRGAEVRQQLAPEPIVWVENTAVHNTNSGSLHSLQFAVQAVKQVLDSETPLLVMDADIIYQKAVLVKYVKNFGQRSSVLVSQTPVQDLEQVLVYGDSEHLRWIGKGLTPTLTENAACLGESVGMLHVAPKDHRLAKHWLNWLVGDPTAKSDSLNFAGFGPAKIASEHEELSQKLMHHGKLSAYCLDKDSLFMEVDFEEDYQHVCQTLYPQILNADAH